MSYVCMCNPTTDHEIKIALKTISCEQELKTKLKICQGCKCCEKEISLLYNQSKKVGLQTKGS